MNKVKSLLKFVNRIVYRDINNNIIFFDNPTEIYIKDKRKYSLTENGNWKQYNQWGNKNAKFTSDNIKWMVKCNLILK